VRRRIYVKSAGKCYSTDVTFAHVLHAAHNTGQTLSYIVVSEAISGTVTAQEDLSYRTKLCKRDRLATDRKTYTHNVLWPFLWSTERECDSTLYTYETDGSQDTADIPILNP